MDATYLNEIKAEFGISSEVDTAQQIMQRFVTPQYVSQTNGMFNVVVFDDNEPGIGLLLGDEYGEGHRWRYRDTSGWFVPT